MLGLGYLAINQAQKVKVTELKQHAYEQVILAQTLSLQHLDLVVRDILYISNSELLNAVLETPALVPSNTVPAPSLDTLARDWQALMAASSVYDQIRWIDEQGQERLRINRNPLSPTRTPEDNLQNKRDRYYFTKAMGLSRNQFYFSPFDLNVERGLIEEPRKSMIRVTKPVFDAQGNKRGVIVLNYLGSEMLSQLQALKEAGSENLWLTNEQGYWLLADTPEDEWGFMYGRSDLTLKNRYPEVWQAISSQDRGYFTNENGLSYFSTIRPMQATVKSHLATMNEIVVDEQTQNGKVVLNPKGYSPYFWKVVYFIPNSKVVSLLQSVRNPYYQGLFFGFLLILVGSLYLARARLAKEHAQETLQESVELYSGVLSASMDGFVLMNREGLVLENNHALLDIMHLHQDTRKIEGTLLEALFEGEQRQKVADHIRTIFENGYCKIEVECLRDNEIFYTEISFMPVEATQQICAFMRDITEHKANEFELQMAASVFSYANEGIILTDSDFRIVDVNEEFELITRSVREEVVGKTPSLLESTKQSKAFYTDMKRDLLVKGHWYGELWSHRKTGEPFLAFLNVVRVKHLHHGSFHFVWMFTDITLEKQYQKRLLNSAHYDQLTNLPNRFLLNDRIQQAMVDAKRNKHSLAIIFIDLDGFKLINDRFGHDMGDALLMHVSKQMKKALRASDTVARIGGDEFVAVVGGLQHADEATPIIDKLLTALSTPVKKANQPLQVSGSLGVTFYPQTENLDGEQLIRQADQAMYQAKQSGKNNYHIFDVKKDALNRDLIRDLNNFEQGLLNDEFVLHYQPKVSLFTNEVIGVEALIRWQHPQNGLLYPGDFLSCVENTQLSIKMTEWVVRKALAQVEAWQEQGLNLPVSINIGAMELQKANFDEWITGLLDEYPSVPRNMLELEVLETSALEDVRSVQSLIERCKKLGISFALDDFGTGFASLSYLKRLPIETIKIDQSFIRNMFDDPEDITLLEGLIGLTQSLNRKVIAEGIETESHGRMLIELGCHYGQGYFIAKPMVSKLIPDFLARWTRPDSWIHQLSEMKKERG